MKTILKKLVLISFTLCMVCTACKKENSSSLPEVLTSNISTYTTSTAIVGGYVNSDGGVPITDRGVFWGTNSNPETSGTKLQLGSGLGLFSSTIEGLTPNTTYHVKAYATNSVGTTIGSEETFTTDPITISDIDGNTYDVIRIGAQLWMKENLKTTKYQDGSIIPNITDNTIWASQLTGAYCWYNNNAATYKNIYGALYNFHTVADNRKLCPSGWHVPTDNEWAILETYLGGDIAAGGKMKSITLWNSPNTGATNISGFTGLPGGYRTQNGLFGGIGKDGIWWSSTVYNETDALVNILNYEYSFLGRGYYGIKESGYSIRCLKDI